MDDIWSDLLEEFWKCMKDADDEREWKDLTQKEKDLVEAEMRWDLEQQESYYNPERFYGTSR